MNEAKKGAALVTGASTGIGAVYADRLAKRGRDLILVARGAGRLADAAERIRAASGRVVETLVADLGRADGISAVEARLKTDAAVTVLVNNAGVGAVTPLLQSDADRMGEMIALNIGALTRLTYAAAPRFAERGHGTIVNIGSVVGISPETLNGVYGASKAYVLAFTQSLQHELAARGVRIQAVLPGATATDFWSLAGLPHENLPKSMVMSADQMVDAALAGLDAGELVTIPSLHDGQRWLDYEASRLALSTQFANAVPAQRYASADAT